METGRPETRPATPNFSPASVNSTAQSTSSDQETPSQVEGHRTEYRSQGQGHISSIFMNTKKQGGNHSDSSPKGHGHCTSPSPGRTESPGRSYSDAVSNGRSEPSASGQKGIRPRGEIYSVTV